MNLLSHLNWRYATKKFDPAKIVPRPALDDVLEAIRLAPTSSGLQPFEVTVISNKDLREKLQAVAFNQPQVTDASHLLVFAAWDKYTPERINQVFDHVVAERGGTSEGFEAYRQNLIKSYTAQDAQTNFEHAARQAYIALGMALAAAAELKIDSTPMEGFDPAAFDELLELKKRGLRTVAIMALGYRDTAGDWLVNLKKVRRAKNDLIKEVG